MKRFLFAIIALITATGGWAYEPHWTPNTQGFAGTMQIIAAIKLDCSSAAYDDVKDYEVGIFCGDECRGCALPENTSFLGVFYSINVCGNNADVLSFRVYDHKTEQEVSCTYDGNNIFEIDDYVFDHTINIITMFTATFATTGNLNIANGQASVYVGNATTPAAFKSGTEELNDKIKFGTTVKLKAANGYKIKSASNDDITGYLNGDGTEFSFSMPAANASINYELSVIEYGLTTGTSEHGTLTFKVGDDEVTEAAENAEVIVTINAATGWQASGVTAEASTTWGNATARPRTSSTSSIPFANITPTKVAGTTNQWKFTMPPAAVTVSATYLKLLTHSDIKVTVADATYNGTAQEPEVTVKDGTTTLKVNQDYTLTYSHNVNAAKATDGTDAPTVTITAAENSTKYAGNVSVTFTINKAVLKVIAIDEQITFDDDAPTYSAIYDTFLGDDNISTLDGSLTFSCGYRKGDNAGLYSISPSGLSSDNYAITFESGTLTVREKSFNVSFAESSVKKKCDDEPFTNALTSEMTGTVSYKSSTPAVATVDGNGLVTIHRAGKTYITGSVYVNNNYKTEMDSYLLEVEGRVIQDDPGMKIIFDGAEYTVDMNEDIATGKVIPDDICDAHLSYTRMLSTEGKTVQTIDSENQYLSTICLPFAPQFNAKFFTLTSVNGGTLKFDEIEGKPKAYTPYLVSAAHNVAVKNVETLIVVITDPDKPQQEDVTEEYDGTPYTNQADMSFCSNVNDGAPVDGYQLKGTLRGLTNEEAAAEGAYILQSNGKWGAVKVGSETVYIPPFRAYIVAASQNAREIGSSFDDCNTSIKNIVTVDSDGTEHWYDLQGRSIKKPATKGIYIHNGRKETIK